MTFIFLAKKLILVAVSLFIVFTFIKIIFDSYTNNSAHRNDPVRFKNAVSNSYFWKSQWDSSSLGKVTIHTYDPALQNGKTVYLSEFLRDKNTSHCFVGTYIVVGNLNSDWALRGVRPKKSKLREYASSSAQPVYMDARAIFDTSQYNCENWLHKSW